MKLPSFDYACPATIAEAIALLAAHGGEAKPIAGGQSLVPMLAFRLTAPTLLVDLRKLSELRQIKVTDAGVTLGAMVRWRDILQDPRLRQAHPLLVAAIADLIMGDVCNRGDQKRMRLSQSWILQNIAPAHHGAEGDARSGDRDLA